MTYEELKKKQVGGSHYKGAVQPWDLYRAMFTREEWVGYLKGTIMDYLIRKKNGFEDLLKAQHVLDVLVATEEEKSNQIINNRVIERRIGLKDRRVCFNPHSLKLRRNNPKGRRSGDDVSYMHLIHCQEEK